MTTCSTASIASGSGASRAHATAISPPAGADFPFIEEQAPFGLVVPHDDLGRGRFGERDGDQADRNDRRHHEQEQHRFLRCLSSCRGNTSGGACVASLRAASASAQGTLPGHLIHARMALASLERAASATLAGGAAAAPHVVVDAADAARQVAERSERSPERST